MPISRTAVRWTRSAGLATNRQSPDRLHDCWRATTPNSDLAFIQHKSPPRTTRPPYGGRHRGLDPSMLLHRTSKLHLPRTQPSNRPREPVQACTQHRSKTHHKAVEQPPPPFDTTHACSVPHCRHNALPHTNLTTSVCVCERERFLLPLL
uniref:Uncharacterized protein n=1 Tax=Arundo donax TaxID=35708 RepID=A0A0A9A569_ARUDO